MSEFKVSHPVGHGFTVLGGHHPGAEQAAREALLVARMQAELEANRHKRSWTTLTPEYVMSELVGHLEKLAGSGSWEHAADVANLAAMYADLRAAAPDTTTGTTDE